MRLSANRVQILQPAVRDLQGKNNVLTVTDVGDPLCWDHLVTLQTANDTMEVIAWCACGHLPPTAVHRFLRGPWERQDHQSLFSSFNFSFFSLSLSLSLFLSYMSSLCLHLSCVFCSLSFSAPRSFLAYKSMSDLTW